MGDASSHAFRLSSRCYEAATLLKSALGIETYLARDQRTGERVVLKRTRAADVPLGVQLRVEHEAEVLRDLAPCGVTPPVDVGCEGDTFFLVRPFVEGVPLRERIVNGDRLSAAETLALGRDLMRALEAAHRRGVLHRAVSPSNVILRREGATLVDFGLVRTLHLDASVRDAAVGTLAYVSPEQAGLLHSEIGERSDLYSAGAVLFECLAGVPPFAGPRIGEILRQHLTERPAPLAGSSGVPRALEDLVQHLLRKDPRDRYQSAVAVLADLDEIATGLEQGNPDPTVVIGAHDRRRMLTEPALVGRGQELRAFEEQLSRTLAGHSVLLRVEGESGTGKTRLLDHAADVARQRGAWVLRGATVDPAIHRPLQAFEGITREILATARHDPSFAEALRARVGEHVDTLCAALPSLAELLSPEKQLSLGPEVHGEARTVSALTALLDALGTSSRPAVVLLDDCQWMGDLSLKLLLEWHRAHDAGRPATGVLVVAAYRVEEVAPDSPLARLAHAPSISLGALGPGDVRRMAESMAGPLPQDAIDLVARLSEGNPFLVAAVLEGLTEGGALVDGPAGWALGPDAMARAQASRRWAAFLAHRLDDVPPHAMELLSSGAILGKSFDVDLAAELAGQSVAEGIASVAEARRRRLVWWDPKGSRCTFVHDRLRDAVLDRLAPESRRRLHQRAAAALEEGGRPHPDREFDLAYHFDAAGDPVRALPPALSAASRARAQYALEVAERYYRIAERASAHTSIADETRREIAEALGDVLLMRGRYDEAAACLARARALAAAPIARAAIDAKAGELAFKRGDVRAAAGALERALPLLGRRVPTSPVAMALATLALVVRRGLRRLVPRRLLTRPLAGGDADLLAARILSRLAYAYWFLRGQLATFWAHLSELELAERYPPTRELAQAYSEHSISVTGLPRFFFRRGVRYAERGLAIRRALGDVWGEGQSLNFNGLLLYAFGHYREALESFREALRLLRRTGDRWEANVAGAHIAFCHYRLGALRDAVAECHRVHREGLEIGDRHATAIVLEVWAKATGGAVPADLVESALGSSDGGDPLSRASLLQASAVCAIGAGRPLEAAAGLVAAEQVARSAHLRNEYVSYIPLWTVRALRLFAVGTVLETGLPVPRRLPGADAALRRGLRSARRHRGNLPMALRERALLRAMRGRRARRDLDASLAEAERQGARFEAAQTLLARGELGLVLGWPGADGDVATARAALREMGAEFACSPMHALPRDGPGEPSATLSLADRFVNIVDQGRRVASALAPEDVHAALCDAAAVLLRGETTLVLSADRESRVLAHCGGPPSFNRSLVEHALREGKPVAPTEVVPEPPHGTPDAQPPRSVLCAPIVTGDRRAGCLYVTHPFVGDLFLEDEKQLAGYLVTLAGASLQKAEAFAHVQELSRTLLAANAELDANLRRLQESQEETVQAAKMATVGTLVAGLSHEMNNPLSAILAHAQSSLKRIPEGDPLRPALLAIERQARRSADLIRTLLDFSHKRPLEREETPVAELVQRVASLASLKLRRGGATLEIEVPHSGACTLLASRTQIESALLNLVLNAVDASPRGAVVRIEAVPLERDGRGGVEISVRDHGTGIPPEVLSRVFDPFFTTKPAGAGTGLGLSLARRFVEAHDGHLAIESQVGEGTTVRFWLPTCEPRPERAFV